MASEPELVRVRQQQAFESQRQTVEAKLQSGQPLDIYEAIFLSKYYPDVSKQMARPVYGPAKPAEQQQTRIPTPLELRQRETKEFGQDIGNVKSLVGPGKYGTLTGWFLGRSEEAERFEGLMPLGPKTSKGLEATAGFVASGEGLVNPYTPFVLSPSFIIGYGAGVVVVGYGLGKVTKPLTEPFTDWLKKKGSSYLTRQYATAVKEGRQLSWKGPKERIVQVITGGAPKEVPPQFVDVPDIGYAAPRTMSEKVLKLPELQQHYQLKGLQPIEAEAGALSFGTTTRTALLDPELISPLENPITREIFTHGGLPQIPDVARMPSFLPQAIGLAGIVGLQIGGSQYAKAMAKTELVTRGTPKIELLSRSTASLKPLLDLGSDVSLLPILALEPVSIQRTLQEPIAQTIQTPRTAQSFPPEFVQVHVPVFPRQTMFTPDFNRFFKLERGKKGKGWSHRYMWEFPVKGPKEMWKAI